MAKIRVSDKTIERILQMKDDEREEDDVLGKMLGINESTESSFQQAGPSPKHKELLNHTTMKRGNTSLENKSAATPKAPAITNNSQLENIMESPELTYTPGKSRLDAFSMARLKAKYSGSTGNENSTSIQINQLSENETMIFSVNKSLSNITPATGIRRRESTNGTPRNALSTIPLNNQPPAFSQDKAPVSEPAPRMAPSPNPETLEVRKKLQSKGKKNPVRFLDNPVVKEAHTPTLVPSEWNSSPIDTAINQDKLHRVELAGRTPKLRQDLVPLSLYEKSSISEPRKNDYDRLWTVEDFAINSNSPNETYSPVEIALSFTAPSVKLNTPEVSESLRLQYGLSTSLKLQTTTPESSGGEKFNELANDLSRLASINVAAVRHVAACSISLDTGKNKSRYSPVVAAPVSAPVDSLVHATSTVSMTPTDVSPIPATVIARRAVVHDSLNDSRISPEQKYLNHHEFHEHAVDTSNITLNMSRQLISGVSTSRNRLHTQSDMSASNVSETLSLSTIVLDPPTENVRVYGAKPPIAVRSMNVPLERPQVSLVVPSQFQRANASITSETDHSIDFTGVSLGRPLSRGKHRPLSHAPKASTPLKMPLLGCPAHLLVGYPQDGHYSGILTAPSNYQPALPDMAQRLTCGSAQRVSVDQKYLDICDEDYDDVEEDEEVFKLISDEPFDQEEDSETEDELALRAASKASILCRTSRKPRQGLVSFGTQVTPGITNEPIFSHRPVLDMKDINFDVSDDSEDEKENRVYLPRSPFVKERLDDSGEFGLEELLMSGGSKASTCRTGTSSLTKTLTTMADSYHQRHVLHESPQTLSSGPRRVALADQYNDSFLTDDDENDSIKLSEDHQPNISNYRSNHQELIIPSSNAELIDPELDNSAMFTAATTLSLDSEMDYDIGEQELPRMVITKRQRSAKECSDVKEIVVAGTIGAETTIILTFANHRSYSQKLTAKAVQMRYDSFKHVTTTKYCKTPLLTPGGGNLTSSAFEVYPKSLLIEPDSETTLHVRFLPMSAGIYSGVLKIRSSKKSFVLLLRGEASIESLEKLPSSILNPNKGINGVDPSTEGRLVMSPTSRRKNGSDKGFNYDSVLTGHADPLLLRQKWMREWLVRASERTMATVVAAPAITTIARHNGVIPSRVKSVPVNHLSASISVIPSSLRLLPQRQDDVKTGLLQGNLLVRNFSSERIEIGIATSSPSIRVKSDRISIAAHDATSVFVEFDTTKHQISSPISIDNDNGAHVGYVMITSNSGEEFVAAIKMPPSSCLSPFISDELAANQSLRDFVNADNHSPCEESSLGNNLKSDSNLTTVTELDDSRMKEVFGLSSPQDNDLCIRKREQARNRNTIIPQSLDVDLIRDKEGISAASPVPKLIKRMLNEVSSRPTVTLINSGIKLSRGLQSPRRVHSPSPRKQPFSPLRKSVMKSAIKSANRSSGKKIKPTKFASHENLVKERDESVKNGVFFRKLFADFGTVAIGSLTRQKIELCNSTDKDMLVLIKDPSLPFVTLHNEIRIKANSYVRLPVRFVPVTKSHFEFDLIGRVASTGENIRIVLFGQSE